MERQNNYVEDIINRYIYQVTKNLPATTRKDIEEELRTLIYDMLEERTKENNPTEHDINAVLMELGKPSELAAKYRDNSLYLIGPNLFPTYLQLLKIVLPAILLTMSIISVLELLTSPGQIWYDYLGNWFSNIWGGLFEAFTWITVIFAIFERKGLSMKDFTPKWEISSLPPLPKKETAISMVESILGIVFHIILMVLLISAPQLLGVFVYSDRLSNIPVFNLETLDRILPLLLISIGFGILKNIIGLIERRYSIKYAVSVSICTVVELLFTIIIFTGFPIWNKNFLTNVNAVFHLGLSSGLNHLWNSITSNFVLIIILIYLIELGSIFYKTFKNQDK